MLQSLALFVFRAIFGAIFIVHGYPKLFGGPGRPVAPVAGRYLGRNFVEQVEHGGPSGVAGGFRSIGLPFPTLLAWVAGLTEFGGGLLLLLGLFTRPAALLLAIQMAVAIKQVHWRNGLLGPGGFDMPLALLAGLIGLLGVSPGELSLERLLAPKERPAARVSPFNLIAGTVLATSFLGYVGRLWRASKARAAVARNATGSPMPDGAIPSAGAIRPAI